MKRTGWAIALAAAWLTPAAAQVPASTPAVSTPVAAKPNAAPPAGFAQDANKPDSATAASAQEPVAIPTMAPTPGIGQPDGRMGLQDQVSPIGREASGFHDYILLTLCAIISAIVLAMLLWVIIRYRRGANPVPSRNSHNTAIEVIWTLVPVLILVAIAIPSIRLLRHQYTPPPADVTIKVTATNGTGATNIQTSESSFDSYMLKEKNDPTRQANQRFRTAADGLRVGAIFSLGVVGVEGDSEVWIFVAPGRSSYSYLRGSTSAGGGVYWCLSSRDRWDGNRDEDGTGTSVQIDGGACVRVARRHRVCADGDE